MLANFQKFKKKKKKTHKEERKKKSITIDSNTVAKYKTIEAEWIADS